VLDKSRPFGAADEFARHEMLDSFAMGPPLLIMKAIYG